ncbi:FAD:protein FMN transferase [Lactobacillus sp. DCY120]|uniref:FAD:protein FMN transferase n=1 Tax=Bombilactobacillus apium TaxID=2675299 RepID=A0A850R5W8_9LACO|nr:FAD:protein FMN transferase [Bombilactobacillus apium]NVY96022.1 FAD:protein FMN transferase [Bombilactobacillus apium]
MDWTTGSFQALGTKIKLSVDSTSRATEALERAQTLINHLEDQLTVNRTVSEVMLVNQQSGKSPVTVSPGTYQLIQTAVQVSRWQLGFNVAIGPLVKLWRIGFPGAHKPTAKEIADRLSLIDPEAIELNPRQKQVFLRYPGMELDLGGIAKGYIADQVKDLWQSLDVKTGIIDLGGNILLVGSSGHSDGLWRVGVQNPKQERQTPLGVLTISEQAVGTSGIYERKLIIDQQSYHHMFDSQTGYPIANNLASVTIVSPTSIAGEIWSTIAFYQGLSQGLPLIEAQPGIEAIFVTKDLQVWTSSGVAAQFVQVSQPK